MSSGAGVHGLSRAASAAHRLSGAAATVGDLARRHRPFTAVLVVAALLRAAVFFAYRPALIFPDSGRYLEYAFRFARGWIIPDTMRASGYSFLLLPMGWWHYLGLAPLFQHAFGLASGVLVYALLVRRGSRRSVATLAALPVLFDPLELNLEQYILPDTIAAFCILAAFAVLVWRGRELSRRAAAGAGGLLLLATVMRLPDLVLVAPVLVYLAATVRPWRLMAARAGVLVAVVAIPLVAYMGWFAGTRGQWTLTTYSGRFLYGRVARFADCQGLSLPSYERSLCPRRPLGHRASEDFYMWYPQSPQWTYRPPPGMVAEKVILDFSLRVVAHQPLAYAHVVADNLGYGFWPWRGSGPDNYPQWYHRFQPYYPDFHHTAAYNLRTYGHTTGKVQPQLARVLTSYGLWYVPGPLLGLGLVIGLAAAAGLGRASRSDKRTASLLFALGTIAVLVPPAALSVFDWRYEIPQLYLVPVAAVLGLGAIRGQAPAPLGYLARWPADGTRATQRTVWPKGGVILRSRALVRGRTTRS